MNVKRHIILDDRTRDYLFEGDDVVIHSNKGEVFEGSITRISAFGIDLKQKDIKHLTVVPFKWIDHICRADKKAVVSAC